MGDLVVLAALLRREGRHSGAWFGDRLIEAATLIEQQAEMLAMAREALRAIIDAPMIDHQNSERSAYGIARATLAKLEAA